MNCLSAPALGSTLAGFLGLHAIYVFILGVYEFQPDLCPDDADGNGVVNLVDLPDQLRTKDRDSKRKINP